MLEVKYDLFNGTMSIVQVSGGSSGSGDGGQEEVSISGSFVTLSVKGGTFYKLTDPVNTLMLRSIEQSSKEATISFTGMTAGQPGFAFPSTLKWLHGQIPTFAAGKSYLISIVDRCAVIGEFAEVI